jgi:WD40 repeat protein
MLPLRSMLPSLVGVCALIGCTAAAQRDSGIDASVAAEAPLEASAPVDAPAASPDLRVSPSGLPLPAGVAPARRILDGLALLTGDGASSCSRQIPPSGNGDRWCAFTVSASTAELWVMDVTRAATGEVPRCDGTDPACLRLTSTLWTASPLDGPAHPYAHAFDGDSLIFYADSTTTSTELHRGPVFLWRPGWSRARQISSGRGLLCAGHPTAAVAYCLDDVAGDPLKPDSFELRGGPVADQTGDLLPSLGRGRPIRADGKIAWQVSFSPDGSLLVLSSSDPDPAVEALRVIATSDIGRLALKEVLSDVTSWTISNDGKRLFFLRPAADGTDDLYAADLPAAATVTKLGSKVTGYRMAGEGPTAQGLGFFTGPSAAGETTFSLLSDPAQPGSPRTLFSFEDTFEDLRVSPDGRFTVWRNNVLQARVVRHTDLGSCLLNVNETLQATLPRFSASAGLVFWTETIADGLDRQDGFFANPDGCTGKTRYAQAIYQVNLPIADRGLIFGDEYDQETVTLKYAGLEPAAASLKPAVRISEGVQPAVVPVGGDPLLLLFQKKGPPDVAGTYLFGPVPF